MFQAIIEFLKSLFVFTGCVEGRSFPGKLTEAEEHKLIVRMTEGDEKAKNELIERNLRLVAHIAKKYRTNGRDIDDLISIGSLGLIKAVSTYSPAKGRSLAAYAGRCIENEILMSIRAERKRRGEVSLEEPIGTDGDGNEITVGDVLGTDEDEVFGKTLEKLSADRLKKLVNGLDPRDRFIIIMRYGLEGGEPLPQREVARMLRISRSYVSRIEKRALGILRAELENTNRPV